MSLENESDDRLSREEASPWRDETSLPESTPSNPTPTDSALTDSKRQRRSKRLVELLVLIGFFAVGLSTSGVHSPSSAGPATGLTFELPRDLPLPEHQPRNRLRVAQFNIHSGVGSDGHFDLERTAQLLSGYDWVGLNEVRGSGYQFQYMPQAEQLARLLKLPFLFAPTEQQWLRDSFGNAALTSLPTQHFQRIPLPRSRGRGYRNLLLTRVRLPAGPVTILVTHLDRTVDRAEQLRTIHELFTALAPPVVLMGDLNTTADDPQIQAWLSEPGVIDALDERNDPPAQTQRDRIDWILVRGLKVLNSGLVTTPASDHPLVWAELEREPSPE